MEFSKIEWTDHTFNPWIGCQKVSPGCDHCYAETLMDKRFGKVEWGPRGERKKTSAEYWKKPLQWSLTATLNNVRQRVFCASLGDVWDNRVPVEWRIDLLHLIRDTPQLDWLLLTKRPENIAKMLPVATRGMMPWPWANVWLGVSCEDQERFDHRWPILHKVPAAVRFISYEPALGPLTLQGHEVRPNWLICGGESGHGARLMKKQWALDLRDECYSLNVAFFMKQMTGKRPIPDDLFVRQFPRPSLK